MAGLAVALHQPKSAILMLFSCLRVCTRQVKSKERLESGWTSSLSLALPFSFPGRVTV
jgi:hypothetical protein